MSDDTPALFFGVAFGFLLSMIIVAALTPRTHQPATQTIIVKHVLPEGKCK